jgi:hypothetical protein
MNKILNPDNINPEILKKLNEKRDFLMNKNNEDIKNIEKEVLDNDLKKDYTDNFDKKIQKYKDNFDKFSLNNIDLICYFDKFDFKGNKVDFANDKFKEIYQGHIKDIIKEKRIQKK